jgi:hypothetical protein
MPCSLRLLFSTRSDISMNADENIKTAVCRGALLAIVQAVYRYGESVLTLSNGVACLSNISWCTIANYKPDIVKGETLKCIIWAMGRHLHDHHLLSVGIDVLGNLWSHPNHRKIILDQDGLKAVVNAMNNHQEDVGVQRSGWMPGAPQNYSF